MHELLRNIKLYDHQEGCLTLSESGGMLDILLEHLPRDFENAIMRNVCNRVALHCVERSSRIDTQRAGLSYKFDALL